MNLFSRICRRPFGAMARQVGAAVKYAATGRFSMSTLAGGFEGAMMHRRLVAWKATQENINGLLSSGGDLLRARARQIVRANPYASNACETFVANAVGAGVKPSSLVEDQALKDKIQKTWLAWTDEADADGLTDLYGLQALAVRAMFEAGECFIRFRPRRPEDGLTVPLQIQLLEAEMLPLTKTEIGVPGNPIRCGIEFDAIGRRVAYHFYRNHPGDSTIVQNQGKIVRVPASEVLHIYRPQRPGQIRGVPWISPALVKLYLLDQYDDAELDRKKVAALFAGFITKASPEDNLRRTDDPWQGLAETQTDTEFFVFKNSNYGIRALARTLIKYQDKHGLRSIRQIIGRWSPSAENDTVAYIKAVSSETGFAPDVILDMHKYEHLKAIVIAIIHFENSQQPYTAAQIDKALVLAGVEPPPKNLQHTRTVKGGQAATAATIGFGALESIRDGLDPARNTLQTLVPYLDVAKWLLLAITLIGIGVMIWARIDDNRKGLR
ncbi:MAG: phage portal protein [Alphaproteobacteria bacterium]|nr:phage portal protein [Alphaproteobacteria bacterium]